MRHKYATRGIVVARSAVGEANALLTLLTPELGLVRAQATGLRRSGAKLSAALATLAESDVVLVRGKEVWRISGAVLVENRFRTLSPDARVRMSRVVGLLLRLVPGESRDPALFEHLQACLQAFREQAETAYDSIEILAALILVRSAGLDAGDMPQGAEQFAPSAIDEVQQHRAQYIKRINEGIAASGL